VKFVYYRSLASCFDLSIEKLDDVGLAQLKEEAEIYFKKKDSLICENQALSMTEVFALIDSLKNSSTIVFHDWIQRDKAISKILRDHRENLNLQERVSHKKYIGHALEKGFYSFLTPFLFPLLEREVAESIDRKDFERLRFYLQYSDFLEESKKITLQQEVDGQLRSIFLEIIADFRKRDESKSNDKKIKSLVSLNLVDVLNLMDKQFYSLRITYIDTIKGIMVQPDVEPDIFKLMSRAISSVELSSSHKSQVESFLQKGKTNVYRKQRTTVFNKALLRNPLTYLGFVVIIILALFILPFDFKNKELTKNQRITGLDSLSQDEVKQTDSLLAFNEDSVLFETDDMKVPRVLPDFILSDNSSDIKNGTVGNIYESMLNDYEIQQKNDDTDCDPLKEKELKDFNYKSVDEIQTQFTNHKLINNSSQDCYFMIFDNKEEGAVFGGFVLAGSSIELKIVKSWRVIFYTGKGFTKFNPLKISNNGYGNLDNAKKIDKTFTTHFCEMNYSNFRVLSKIYDVVSIGEKTRLMNGPNGAIDIQSNSIKAVK
jgi:hypothetical protein